MNFTVRFILLLSSPLISSVATAQTVVKYIHTDTLGSSRRTSRISRRGRLSRVPPAPFPWGLWEVGTGRDEGAIQSQASGSVKTSCQNGACTP